MPVVCPCGETHAYNDFCSEKCEKKYLDYKGFYAWYKTLLNSCADCFERDVLRYMKNELWTSWSVLELKRLRKIYGRNGRIGKRALPKNKKK